MTEIKCSECNSKELRLVMFSDGQASPVFWCNERDMPCNKAYKECEK